MLSSTHLAKLATKYQTTELNIRREYGQHLLLSYIYQQPAAADLHFKGGTALRLIYHSPRFSEDLDFDTPLHDVSIWEKVLESSLLDVSRENIEVDIQESKITTGGYLAIINLKNLVSPLSLHLEISFRKNTVAGEIFTIENDFIPPYPIKALSTTQLVDGKLHALFDRGKARDFYDLYFLLRAGLLTLDQKKQLERVQDILRHTSINFDRELSLFLPKSQSLVVHDFKKTLLQEIDRNT